MFGLTGREVRALQGAGGEPFTAFVDALLRAHCAIHGLPDADLETNIRTTIADGGVDTTVGRPIPQDPTGWLAGAPTAWQHKARDYRHFTVGSMLDGAAVRARIQEGYAFRLAIADSMPGDTRRDWQEHLTEQARAIRADAPEARVLTADDLAAWAAQYPGLVLSIFHPRLAQNVLHLDAWRPNVLNATPHFVPVGDWGGTRELLTRHVTLSETALRAVMALQGEAGVGKTRLAYEVVAALTGAAALVVYCLGEEDAVRVATELANDARASAVLVADECGILCRERLERTLAGHRARVRVITISTAGECVHGVQPELELHKMSRDTLTNVLDLNYPQVLQERRRGYAALAEGFPRLAADLCAQDVLIARAGHVGPVVPGVYEFLRLRLTDAQLEALAALSLVTKAGYAGEFRNELDGLCDMLGLERNAVERSLHEVHDGPGFVARTERYFYVTPELVARVAYEEGWRRWGRDTTKFFEQVPDGMVQTVLDRAWRSAPEEVRRAFAAHFRDWADALTPPQLREVASVRRLVALADTHPSDYLPRIRRLVEAAPLEILTDVTGDGLSDGRWGPRRELVWLAERFALFPEHFDDAERMLLGLALAESEPGIANNATAIWCQLYRIYLSGTAVPFFDRLKRLRTRMLSADRIVRALAAVALAGVFQYRGSRTLGPAVVGGRLPPEDWRPQSAAEERSAVLGALNLLSEASTNTDDLRDAAVSIATEHARSLIARGFLGELRDLVSGVTLKDDELSALIEKLDATLAYDYDLDEQLPRRVAPAGAATRDEIAGWRDTLSGRDLHTLLVATVGKDRWAPSRVHAEVWAREAGEGVAEDAFRRELNRLAEEFLAEPNALREELPWLTSDSARSAADLGEAIGLHDVNAALLELLLEAVEGASSRLLVSGYVSGLLTAHPVHADAVNQWLDLAEARMPEATAELAMSAGETAHPLARVLRMFDAGRLPAVYLADRNFATAKSGELPADELIPLLKRLARAAEGGDELAERIGLDAFVTRLPYDTPVEQTAVLAEHPALRAVAWRLLEARPAGSRPTSHWWRQLVVALGSTEPARAARLAGALLGSDDLGAAEDGKATLVSLAANHPTDVMDAIGTAMLDEHTGWRFFVGVHRDLIAAVPTDVVRTWLDRVGVEGARRIARHLPEPYIGEGDQPIVPPLTHWVLETFEADDRTYREFCAGSHSFEVYSGNIAAQHEREAAVARRFLDHPLRRVREWAAVEEQSALAEADEFRRWEEESDLA